MYFSRSVIPNTSRSDMTALGNQELFRHIGVYAYRRKILLELINLPISTLEKVESLEQLRWLYNGYRIRVVETTIETPNIDSPEDIEEVLNVL